MLNANTTILNLNLCYLYPAFMDEKCSFYTGLNNSFKFSKLVDHFSLGAVKHRQSLGKVGTMKSYGEQYNRDADIQICPGCYQFYF